MDPMSRGEIKELGRKVGVVTGLVGYFSGAFGAWSLYVLSCAASGHFPRQPDPGSVIVLTGAILGVVLTMIVATRVIWRSRYREKSFRISGAWDAARGVFSGVFAVITTFVVVVTYAFGALTMWILSASVVIIVIVIR